MRRSLSEVESTLGDFPFAKIHYMGERTHKVRCVPLTSSLGAALPGTRRVSAGQGLAGEKSGHFEHPETFYTSVTEGKLQRCFVCQLSFSAVW